MQPAFVGIAALALAATVAVAWIGAEQGNNVPPVAAAGSGIGGLETRTEQAPEDVEAWKVLAAEYRKRGRTEDAAAAYVRAARLEPDDPEIILALKDLAAALAR
jgi:tetratricopeptide (TPR) repeat protein